MRAAKRVLGLAVVVWAVGSVALFGVGHRGHAVHADAVVVLAGSKTRLPVGLRLVQQGDAPLLVISRGSKTKLETAACQGALQSARVICFTANPSSTRGEAEEIGRLAKRLGWKRIDVVTSEFHVVRARMLIDRCYHGELHMVGSSQAKWKFPLYAVQETAKLAFQIAFARSC